MDQSIQKNDLIVNKNRTVVQEEFRIVVSGLVKHYSLEEMQNRKVVVVANLKAANMRGIKSHAMVLAATGADGKVRISK